MAHIGTIVPSRLYRRAKLQAFTRCPCSVAPEVGSVNRGSARDTQNGFMSYDLINCRMILSYDLFSVHRLRSAISGRSGYNRIRYVCSRHGHPEYATVPVKDEASVLSERTRSANSTRNRATRPMQSERVAIAPPPALRARPSRLPCMAPVRSLAPAVQRLDCPTSQSCDRTHRHRPRRAASTPAPRGMRGSRPSLQQRARLEVTVSASGPA